MGKMSKRFSIEPIVEGVTRLSTKIFPEFLIFCHVLLVIGR